jgi:hypothetical protein
MPPLCIEGLPYASARAFRDTVQSLEQHGRCKKKFVGSAADSQFGWNGSEDSE